MNKYIIEMLHQKYVHSVRALTRESKGEAITTSEEIEKKKYFFIQYGLSHPDYLDYCLDYLDIFGELDKLLISFENDPLDDLESIITEAPL